MWILTRHVLPSVAAPVARHAVLRLPGIALALASLGFLGLGAQPPAPEWGLLLDESRAYVERAPWAALAPAVALALLVSLAVSGAAYAETRTGRRTKKPSREGTAKGKRTLTSQPKSDVLPESDAPPESDVPPTSDVPPESDVLLSVRGLRIAFDGVEAVRGLSFDVRPREVLALVGESGAGKSLTARALLGLLPRGATTSGTVRLRGDTDLAAQRGRRITLVPQDALSALSPVHPVGDQLTAAVRSVAGVSRKEARARAVAALDRVGIPDAVRRARAYPHEYSGGMRQRAVIAMATINEPDVVVADEPTTALDAELQEQVLRVLGEQREAVGAALVLVTHDLGVVREHADRVLVMCSRPPGRTGFGEGGAGASAGAVHGGPAGVAATGRRRRRRFGRFGRFRRSGRLGRFRRSGQLGRFRRLGRLGRFRRLGRSGRSGRSGRRRSRP